MKEKSPPIRANFSYTTLTLVADINHKTFFSPTHQMQVTINGPYILAGQTVVEQITTEESALYWWQEAQYQLEANNDD